MAGSSPVCQARAAAPSASKALVSIRPLDSRTMPGAGSAAAVRASSAPWPLVASSSPVTTTPTRGRASTGREVMPRARATPISPAPTWSPASASRSSRVASSPRPRMWRFSGGSASRVIVTSAGTAPKGSASVASTSTTASAPPGAGAPVMMRMATPRGSSGDVPGRAGMSATTGRRVAPGAVRSDRRTAKPSIADSGTAGMSSGLVTGRASTRPRASPSGRSRHPGTRTTCSRTVARQVNTSIEEPLITPSCTDAGVAVCHHLP